jgi:excinuclease UvrABC nuclease subunit
MPPPSAPHTLPAVPACYVLALDGEVVYVGQTLNLQARFYAHRIKHRKDDSWRTAWGDLTGDLRLKVKFGQRYGDWCMREARLIDRLKPRFNTRRI